MKIALAQLNFLIGDFERNFKRIEQATSGAIDQQADLIVFPELAICGYPPRDFLEFDDFIQRCDAVILQLLPLSEKIGILVGSPTRNPEIEGKDLFNSAAFLHEGAWKQSFHKSLLPNYDVFDEYRYFEPNHDDRILEFKGKRLAITICEDIWNVGNENPLYPQNPMDTMMAHEPHAIINLSASPFHYNQARERLAVIRANVDRYQIPLFYVNHVGAQTELIFDGGSVVMDGKGKVVEEMPYFEEAVKVFDLEALEDGRHSGEQPKNKNALIHDGLVIGLRNYFEKLGFEKAILGLSGGIDSAVTLVLAVRALGSENVRSILLPSQFSSDHSIEDSIELCENLGSPYDIVPISDANQAMLDTMAPYFRDLPFDIAEENIQARLRAVILMAFSNKFGYILLNTSNKSEAAVGYGTLYGDMCGGLSVIGDVYKTQVYELARYINQKEEVIPKNIINKPPSAELRPDQKDSDSLPDYDILDSILDLYIEKRMSPRQIMDQGYDSALVGRILKLVNMSEWKRYQTAPMLRISPKAFGIGRRMPIVAKYLA
jgi:NAD+ synthase (glutamine-hydrolysing)